MAGSAVKTLTVPQAESKDMLLDFLGRQLMVVTHTDIFLDLLILLSGYMDRAVIMVCQAEGNQGGILFIGFYFFLPAGFGMVIGARMIHFTLRAVSWRYRVNPRHPAS